MTRVAKFWRAKRVPGSGNLGRWIAVPVAGAYVVFISFSILDESFPLVPWHAWTTVLMGFYVGFIVVLIRAPRIGLFLFPDTLVIRSWFRTYEFALSEIGRLDLEFYDGFFYNPGTPDWGNPLRVLSVRLEGDTPPRGFPATVAFRQSAARQLAVARAHIEDTHTPRLIQPENGTSSE